MVIGVVGSHGGKHGGGLPAYQEAYQNGVATAEQTIRQYGLDAARATIAKLDELENQARKEGRLSASEEEKGDAFLDGYRDTVKKHR